MAQFTDVTKKYAWARGSVHRVDAETAATVTQKLEEEGRLTASELVNESRPENAPLHAEFEWDNAVAGEKYREHQARNIIHSLVIVTEQQEPQKVYYHLYKDEPRYKSVEVILQNPDETEVMLKNAKREMEAFAKRYRRLEALTRVVEVIEETLKEIA